MREGSSLTRIFASRRVPAPLVEHAAWRNARTRILAAELACPATLVLLGAAGTGKTWLLADLATALRQAGRDVVLVRQGDMPFARAPGRVVLVDEAARISDQQLDLVAHGQEGLLVLADLPEFLLRLALLSGPPRVVEIAPLHVDEVPCFVTDWLANSARPDATISEDAVGRLIIHSGCVPRLIAQLLGAALAMAAPSDETTIGDADIDEAAEMRFSTLDGEAEDITASTPASVAAEISSVAAREPEVVASAAVTSPPPETRPARRFSARRARHGIGAASAAALAAMVVLATYRFDIMRPAAVVPLTAVSVPLPTGASITRAEMPAEGVSAAPALVAVPVPPLAPKAGVALAAVGRIQLANALPPVAAPTVAALRQDLLQPGPAIVAGVPLSLDMPPPPPPPAAPPSAAPAVMVPAALAMTVRAELATAPPPVPVELASEVPPAAPAALALAEGPAGSVLEAQRGPEPLEPLVPSRPGGPGLALMARPGDTMRGLYGKVYRGMTPPPFADFIAANAAPFRTGSIVVFPTPPSGWFNAERR